MRTKKTKEGAQAEGDESMDKFQSSFEEMHVAFDRLKNGKARDSNGIRAEDIKGCDEETNEWIIQIFNEVRQQKGLYSRVLAESSNQSHIQEG